MTEFYYNCCTYCYMYINENREKILYIDTCTEQEKKNRLSDLPFSIFIKKQNGENKMIFVFYKFLLLHH